MEDPAQAVTAFFCKRFDAIDRKLEHLEALLLCMSERLMQTMTAEDFEDAIVEVRLVEHVE